MVAAIDDFKEHGQGSRGPQGRVPSKLSRGELDVSTIECLELSSGEEGAERGSRKEVIQPQVLLQLPCYDFTPIMNHTVVTCPLAVSAATSSTAHFRDVTGGVYKARERIHRGVLIRDY